MAYNIPCDYKGFHIGTSYSTNDFYQKVQTMRMSAKACAPACQAQVPMPVYDCFVTSTVTTCNKQKEKDTVENMEQNQRRYLDQRIFEVYEEKDRDLRKYFGLSDDDAPSDAADFVERIKTGNYQLREAICYGRHFMDRVRWRKPDAIEDLKGYTAAVERMEEAQTVLTDKARLYSIVDATKAFEEFRATDFRAN